MHLYAVRRYEDVTVADIAAEAGMTAAAVYYHYSTKDNLFFEGLRGFTTGLLEELKRLLAAAPERGVGDGNVLADLVAWMDDHRYAAVVWFVTSPGLSESVERLRQETRLESVDTWSAAFRERGSPLTQAEATVASAGLVVLLEQAAASWLTEDLVFANLGRRRFLTEVAALGDLIGNGSPDRPAG